MLLPLGSGIIYVVGALLLKRAADLGGDVWRTVRACNFTTAALFVPMILLGGTVRPAHDFWQPALAAALFVTGQVLSLLALNIGDVSVATPVLGVKIPLVALLTTVLLGERIGAGLWAAAMLSSVAIALLNFSRAHPHQRIGLTILLATLAAMAYALFDVLVQKWSPAWGAGRFLPIMMTFVAVYSLGLRPFGEERRRLRVKPNPQSSVWLAGGAACLGVQASLFVSSIAVFGQAAVANVLYSSRGLWSVVGVWLAGHWFANREQDHGARVLAWRLIGAALLMAAILIVLSGARS